MDVEVTLNVNIPKSFYCRGCNRAEVDKNGFTYCSLFNRFIYASFNGEILKCRECVNAVYEALEMRI